MADLDLRHPLPKAALPLRTLAALTATLMLCACAQVAGDEATGLLAALNPPDGPAEASAAAAPIDPQKAVEYWGGEYAKDPRDLDKALAYAKSLKALGQKGQALTVLQQASLLHGSDKRLASEYGRLALEMDQVSVAKKLLEVADDPANPDWRVIMARGTVLAKEGRYREAMAFYERAQALEPGHPSVMSNLAMAYIMSGDVEKGEALLRRASADGEANAKVRQNLALALGLQGKYDEAIRVGSVDLPPEKAKENAELLRKIVKHDARPSSSAPASTTAWTTKVAQSMKTTTVDVGSAGPEPEPGKVAAMSAPPAFKPSTR